MVKNITLSAEETVIARARQRAAQEHKSLNTVFRDWLRQYAGSPAAAEEYGRLMRRLSRVDSGGPFTREQLHER